MSKKDAKEKKKPKQLQATECFFNVQRVLNVKSGLKIVRGGGVFNKNEMVVMLSSDRRRIFVRSVEEDQISRLWQLPWFPNVVEEIRKKKKISLDKRIVDVQLSPEADWLMCVTEDCFFYMLPIAKFIEMKRQRLSTTDHQHQQLMSVKPCVMQVKMTSYLRDSSSSSSSTEGFNPNTTNTRAIRRQNSSSSSSASRSSGRYGSAVAGDDQDMSVLALNKSMGVPTCCVWWRCQNGNDFALIGASGGLVSMVNLVTNTEVCCCELPSAGSVNRISIIREKYRKEKRTSMLVETTSKKKMGVNVYFKVVLDRKLKKPIDPFAPVLHHEDIIKDFPHHFKEDFEFKPIKIKKFSNSCSLLQIEDGNESSIAVYSHDLHKLSIYSNFHWPLRVELSLSNILNRILFHGELLLVALGHFLAKGKTKDGKNIAIWVSFRLSGSLFESSCLPLADNYKIIHTIILHDNEAVLGVIPFYSTCEDSECGDTISKKRNASQHLVAYLMYTNHNIYYCKPNWPKKKLFNALCSQAMSVQDAIYISYAMKFDTVSLFGNVANYLCERNIPKLTPSEDNKIINLGLCKPLPDFIGNWILELYKNSHVSPSIVVQKLIQAGGASIALLFANKILQQKSVAMDTGFNAEERGKLAYLVISASLKRLSRPHISVDEKRNLITFLQSNVDYDVHCTIDLLLRNSCFDEAYSAAHCRQQVSYLLSSIIASGLAPIFPVSIIVKLKNSGYSDQLARKSHRILLRCLPINTQIDVLLSHPPSLLYQRDWVLRQLKFISADRCRCIAQLLDPRTVHTKEHVFAEKMSYESAKKESFFKMCDVALSEDMLVSSEERLEFFLTVLLNLCSVSFKRSTSYGQKDLELFLAKLSNQYRPSVMLLRCHNYGNLEAAVVVYETHGEWVEALECRLKVHDLDRNPHKETQKNGTNPGNKSRSADYEEIKNSVKHKLSTVLNDLVISSASARTYFAGILSDKTKFSLLIRIIVHWDAYSLDLAELEEVFLDEANFPVVCPLLCDVFFEDIHQRVDDFDSSLDDQKSKSPSLFPNGPLEYKQNPRGGCNLIVEERDIVFIKKCKTLQFSGSFVFKLSEWYLSVLEEKVKRHSYAQSASSLLIRNVLPMVLSTIERNTTQSSQIIIPPTHVAKLGKNDPIETHTVVFSCGHFFPKRVFEDEILPQFDQTIQKVLKSSVKDMIKLDTGVLFPHTRKLIQQEFGKNEGIYHLPCPICIFNSGSNETIRFGCMNSFKPH